MTELIRQIVLTLMVGLVVLLVVNLWARARLLTILRQRYPRQWERLGSPTLVMNNSVDNGIRTLRFVWSRSWDDLGDEELHRFVVLERVLHILQALGLASALATLISYVATTS